MNQFSDLFINIQIYSNKNRIICSPSPINETLSLYTSTLHAILNSTRQIFFCVKLFFITKNMTWFWQRHSLSNNNFNITFPIHFYVPFSINHILSTWSSFTSSMSLTLSSSFSMPMTYSYSSSSTSYVPSADSPEVPSCTQG